MGDEYLGEFEHLVLLAILLLGDEAYGGPIRRTIEQRAERAVSFGAVYSTLRRMSAKGYVDYEEVAPAGRSGGRPRRIFALTVRGTEVLQAAQRRLRRMTGGIEGAGETV